MGSVFGHWMKRYRVWLPVLIAVLSSLIYLPTVRYGFVWDDHYLIEQNEFLAHASPAQVFTKGFWYNPGFQESLMQMIYYRPLVNLSFLVERKIWGLNPAGYHLTNVLIHTANVVLVWAIVLELLHSAGLAAIAGLLFGVHPALNSVVTYVSNRTYLLAMLAVLAGFYTLVRGRRRRSLGLPILSSAGLLLALLAQEAAITYVAIAAGWLIAKRREYRRIGIWLAATAVACLCYVVLRFLVAHIILPGDSVSSVFRQPFTTLNSFGQQMLLFLVPFVQKVTYAPGPDFTRFSVYTVLGALFLIVPLVLVLRRRSDVTILGYAWAVVFLLPFARLVTLGPSGRMLYLSALGALIFGLAFMKSWKPAAARFRGVAWILLGIYAAAFVPQTLNRNTVWKDENRLNQTKVAEAPDSPAAHDNLGVKLREAGDIEGALREHRRALELDPNFATARNNLGTALFEAGKLNEAISEYQKALRLAPEFAMAHNNLGVAFQQTGDLQRAEAEYRQALRLQSGLALARNNLGEILMQRGQPDSALAEFQQALASQPDYALAHYNLGLVLQQLNRPGEAEHEYRRTLEIMPDFPGARERLKQLLDSQRR